MEFLTFCPHTLDGFLWWMLLGGSKFKTGEIFKSVKPKLNKHARKMYTSVFVCGREGKGREGKRGEGRGREGKGKEACEKNVH